MKLFEKYKRNTPFYNFIIILLVIITFYTSFTYASYTKNASINVSGTVAKRVWNISYTAAGVSTSNWSTVTKTTTYSYGDSITLSNPTPSDTSNVYFLGWTDGYTTTPTKSLKLNTTKCADLTVTAHFAFPVALSNANTISDTTPADNATSLSWSPQNLVMTASGSDPQTYIDFNNVGGVPNAFRYVAMEFHSSVAEKLRIYYQFTNNAGASGSYYTAQYAISAGSQSMTVDLATGSGKNTAGSNYYNFRLDYFDGGATSGTFQLLYLTLSNTTAGASFVRSNRVAKYGIDYSWGSPSGHYNSTYPASYFPYSQGSSTVTVFGIPYYNSTSYWYGWTRTSNPAVTTATETPSFTSNSVIGHITFNVQRRDYTTDGSGSGRGNLQHYTLGNQNSYVSNDNSTFDTHTYCTWRSTANDPAVVVDFGRTNPDINTFPYMVSVYKGSANYGQQLYFSPGGTNWAEGRSYKITDAITGGWQFTHFKLTSSLVGGTTLDMVRYDYYSGHYGTNFYFYALGMARTNNQAIAIGYNMVQRINSGYTI